MAASKKLETIYHNGKPDGIRSIRKNLSTMTTYVIPRSLLSDAKTISGINRPGIYYLINESDDSRIAQIYVGQTRNGVTRLDDHNRSKEFWNKAIMFLAQESKRYKVENTVVPKYEIDEYDFVAVEEIYDEIQFIMATLGYKMDDARQGRNQTDILHTTRNGIEALGIYSGEKFEVLEGSQVIKTVTKSVPASIEKQREVALSNGDIVEKNGQYILTVSMSFSSPSSAASFVLGASANGWVEWKTKDGKTLNDIFRKN